MKNYYWESFLNSYLSKVYELLQDCHPNLIPIDDNNYDDVLEVAKMSLKSCVYMLRDSTFGLLIV